MSDGSDIWGDDLTDAQIKMVIASGEDGRSSGYGVELIGAGAWKVARRLQELGLGWIEGGAPFHSPSNIQNYPSSDRSELFGGGVGLKVHNSTHNREAERNHG